MHNKAFRIADFFMSKNDPCRDDFITTKGQESE